MKAARWIILFLTAVILAACGYESGNEADPLGPYGDTAAAVSAFIEQRMPEERVAGAAVALIDGRQMVWAKGFGFADLENQLPVNLYTVFEVGSLSKTMTGALIMGLVEQGLMDLGDPADLYVPEFRIRKRFPQSGPITIRTLLTHHSGVPGDMLADSFATEFDPQGYTSDLLADLAEDWTTFPTNYRYAYSNAAVILAGEAAAAAGGRDFIPLADDFLAELGMLDSSFSPRPDLLARLSKGYYLGQDIGRYFCNMTASGGAYSTIVDMARYAAFWLSEGDGVLRPETVKEMMTPQNTNVPLDPGTQTGLTWFLSDDWAGRRAEHVGGTSAHWAQVVLLPDQDLAVVALTNSKTGLNMIMEAADLALRLAVEAKTGRTPPPPPEPEYFPPANWSPEELAQVAGCYVPTSGGFDRFVPHEGGLNWTPYGAAEPIYLIPRENGWFSPPSSQKTQFEFTKKSGRSVLILQTSQGPFMYAQKYEPAPPGQIWIDRLGAYDVVDLPPTDMSHHVPPPLRLVSEQAVLHRVDDLLILSTTVFGDLVLRPLSNDRGEIYGLGRQGGTVVRFGDGELAFLGLRYEKAEEVL